MSWRCFPKTKLCSCVAASVTRCHIGSDGARLVPGPAPDPAMAFRERERDQVRNRFQTRCLIGHLCCHPTLKIDPCVSVSHLRCEVAASLPMTYSPGTREWQAGSLPLQRRSVHCRGELPACPSEPSPLAMSLLFLSTRAGSGQLSMTGIGGLWHSTSRCRLMAWRGQG